MALSRKVDYRIYIVFFKQSVNSRTITDVSFFKKITPAAVLFINIVKTVGVARVSQHIQVYYSALKISFFKDVAYKV